MDILHCLIFKGVQNGEMDILHCLIFSWLQAGMAESWSSVQKIYLMSYLTTDGKSHSEETISNQLFLEQPAISIYPCLSINLLFSLFLFSLNQFAAKDLDRKSKKCEKEEKAEKLKLKRVSTTPIKINYCKQNYYSYLAISYEFLLLAVTVSLHRVLLNFYLCLV